MDELGREGQAALDEYTLLRTQVGAALGMLHQQGTVSLCRALFADPRAGRRDSIHHTPAAVLPFPPAARAGGAGGSPRR
jgi:hypothetical protein